jgi:hypothetical protein
MTEKKEKPLAEHTIRVREITRTLQKNFSAEDISSMAKLLANATTCKREKEEQKKSVDSQFKAEIESFNATCNNMSSKISTGYEFTTVPCKIVDDLDTLERQVIRLDTGEIIETSRVPESERQVDAFETGPLDPGAKKAQEDIGELQAPALQIEHKPTDPPVGP